MCLGKHVEFKTIHSYIPIHINELFRRLFPIRLWWHLAMINFTYIQICMCNINNLLTTYDIYVISQESCTPSVLHCVLLRMGTVVYNWILLNDITLLPHNLRWSRVLTANRKNIYIYIIVLINWFTEDWWHLYINAMCHLVGAKVLPEQTR